MDWDINNQQNISWNKRCNYLVLVNKENKVPDNWENNIDLVVLKNVFNRTIKVEKETLEKFSEMRDDLLKEWIDIELDSAYRSLEKQQDLEEDMEEEYGVDYAKKYMANPGYSEHHTGLSIDVCLKKDWKIIHENHEMIVECKIFEKIQEKLADYGFILRYPEWKEYITWYDYEPWHLRYVWDVNVAREIMEKWLTLEEYLVQNKIN